jgi:hypothetical protein
MNAAEARLARALLKDLICCGRVVEGAYAVQVLCSILRWRSLRFGQPKQLLDWRGRPFIQAVAASALEAGLSPVIVVTGAAAESVESAVEALPVIVARNPHWQDGQASSIQAGIAAIPPEAGAAVFLLSDQPRDATVIRPWWRRTPPSCRPSSCPDPR